MTSHVATGILAVLFAVLHGAMDPRDTVGGHALLALALLAVTGAVGRYFYAWVPRAANGRELELEEVRRELGRLSDEWDRGQRAFADRVRGAIEADIEARQWSGSFLGRVRRAARRPARAAADCSRASRRKAAPPACRRSAARRCSRSLASPTARRPARRTSRTCARCCRHGASCTAGSRC
jgi:hypothetical protein